MGHRKLNPLGDTSLLSTLFNYITKIISLRFVNCHLHILTFNEIQTFKNQQSNFSTSSIQVFYGELNAVERWNKHSRKWDTYKTNASSGSFLHLPVGSMYISISLQHLGNISCVKLCWYTSLISTTMQFPKSRIFSLALLQFSKLLSLNFIQIGPLTEFFERMKNQHEKLVHNFYTNSEVICACYYIY